MAALRILSLVPSATDWLAALGLGDAIVGYTHECALPDGRQVPVVVEPAMHHDPTDPAGVDAAVTAAAHELTPLYTLDLEWVADLAPTVVVTQELCDVCAVSRSTLRQATDALAGAAVINMTGVTLAGVLDDGRALADALDVSARGHHVVGRLRDRLAVVEDAVAGADRPSVAFLEWTEPAWVAGHWVPDQIRAAGGVPTVGAAGTPSRRADLETFAGADLLLVGPCGYTLDEAAGAGRRLGARLPQAGAVWAVDANLAWSRPAPGLVDGVEALAGMAHPDRWPAPQARFATLLESAPVGAT